MPTSSAMSAHFVFSYPFRPNRSIAASRISARLAALVDGTGALAATPSA